MKLLIWTITACIWSFLLGAFVERQFGGHTYIVVAPSAGIKSSANTNNAEPEPVNSAEQCPKLGTCDPIPK